MAAEARSAARAEPAEARSGPASESTEAAAPPEQPRVTERTDVPSEALTGALEPRTVEPNRLHALSSPA